MSRIRTTRKTPVRKKRSKHRRVLGREKLYGKAKKARRREIFERSGGRCEAERKVGEWGTSDIFTRCNAPITWETFHWSHNRHGANKCDSMDCGIASCAECHLVGVHAGGKPCSSKGAV